MASFFQDITSKIKERRKDTSKSKATATTTTTATASNSKDGSSNSKPDHLAEGPEIIIVVMGVTGSGKSQFINRVLGGDVTKVGHQLRSQTSEVSIYPWTYNKRRILLVDTPGFDDTYRSDVEVFKDIASFLQASYERNVYVNGILYLHRITDNRMTGTGIAQLRRMQKLIGESSLRNVILVTTFWDENSNSKSNGASREANLISEYWNLYMQHGAKVFRSMNNTVSARNIIDSVLQNNMTVLDLQRELVDEKRTLIQTTVGQEFGDDLSNKITRFQEELTNLKQEKVNAARQRDIELQNVLDEEIQQFQRRISKAEAELETLGHSLSEADIQSSADRWKEEIGNTKW